MLKFLEPWWNLNNEWGLRFKPRLRLVMTRWYHPLLLVLLPVTILLALVDSLHTMATARKKYGNFGAVIAGERYARERGKR